MIRLKRFVKSIWCVWFLLAAWWLVVGVIQWIRYQHDGDTAVDLSIYTQVLWNLSHGYGLTSSIQGHNYFSDHIEPILFLLTPLFRLWPSPLLLLWLQTICLGLAVFPLRRISAYYLGSTWQNAWVLLFLLHSVTWSTALSEFHVYALALPIFLGVISCYLEKNFKWFMVWLVVATLLREDIALVVICFGIMALLRRKITGLSRRWWIWPLLIGVAGLVLGHIVQTQLPTITLVGKYYPWLAALQAGHWSDAVTILWHILGQASPYNMVLVAILSFGVVVICGWEWWIPIMPVLVLFGLSNRSSDTILASDYHGALAAAFFWAALLLGLKRFAEFVRSHKRWKLVAVQPLEFIVAVTMLTAWLFVWAAEPWGIVQLTVPDTAKLVERIGPTDGVAASADLLPQVAARHTVQWAWYLFKGYDEANQSTYQLDHAVEWLLFDTNELTDDRSNHEYSPDQETHFKTLIKNNFALVDSVGPVLLFRRTDFQTGQLLPNVVRIEPHQTNANQTDTFTLFTQPTLVGSTLTVSIQVNQPVAGQTLRFNIAGSGQQTSVLFGYGLVLPTDVQPGDVVTTTIQLPARLLTQTKQVTVIGELIHPNGIYLACNQSTAQVVTVISTVFTVTPH